MELTSPGRVLGGRYRLVQPIARGGMATVWLADDPVLSRKVAVKILKTDLAADEATRARFRHEAISAARLAWTVSTSNAVATMAKSRSRLPPKSPMPANIGISAMPFRPPVILPPA